VVSDFILPFFVGKDQGIDVSPLENTMTMISSQPLFGPITFVEEKNETEPELDEILVTFTPGENDLLRNLPKKECKCCCCCLVLFLLKKPFPWPVLIDDSKGLYLGLVDILLAYCYDHRTTEGDGSVESPWTICKLSPTLSCLETFTSLREPVIAFLRRALCYPLHRHWGLCQKLLQDVYVILKYGSCPGSPF